MFDKYRIDPNGQELRPLQDLNTRKQQAFVQSALHQMNHEATFNDVRTFHLTINGYSPKLPNHMESTIRNAW